MFTCKYLSILIVERSRVRWWARVCTIVTLLEHLHHSKLMLSLFSFSFFFHFSFLLPTLFFPPHESLLSFLLVFHEGVYCLLHGLFSSALLTLLCSWCSYTEGGWGAEAGDVRIQCNNTLHPQVPNSGWVQTLLRICQAEVHCPSVNLPGPHFHL